MAETTSDSGKNKQPATSGEATPGQNLRKWWDDFLNLREGSDRQEATRIIQEGKQMRGSNAWMLVCSIMIASLGLNLNSGAVIIGAMLISPLMNPILGVGLGIATNDKKGLWRALQSFGVAILIALVTSVLYFTLTPINNFTEEMQSRTAPTLLDALVAIFGGLAGIISVTREDKTNAIPGVAIATALMPPLCVAGYGLALCLTDFQQGIYVFWRAFYLFFLNSFFIAVTAYGIIRLLRFPYKKYLNDKDARRSQIIIGVITLFMIAPGIYILTDVIQEYQAERIVRQFTIDHFPASLTSFEILGENRKEPVVFYPYKDRLMNSDSLEHYNELLRKPPYGLAGARIITDTTVNASTMEGIQRQRNDIQSLTSRLAIMEGRTVANYRLISERLDSLRREPPMDSATFSRFVSQFQIAFPRVESVAMGKARTGDRQVSYRGEIPLVAISVANPGRRPTPQRARADRERIEAYLRTALAVDSVLLVVQEE